MIRRRSNPEASVSTRRAEAFTDGVFAIAATLLVLGLTDQSLGAISTNDELAQGLLDLSRPMFSFVISFLILCVMWMTHVRQFEWIVRIDDTGMWLNNIRLLLIVLVPFTSSLDTMYYDFLLGRLLLPVNFFLAIVAGWLQWVWAVRSGAIVEMAPSDARRLGRASLSAVIISAVAMAASPWVGSFGFLLFAFDGPLTRLLRGGDEPIASPAPTPTDGAVGGRG